MGRMSRLLGKWWENMFFLRCTFKEGQGLRVTSCFSNCFPFFPHQQFFFCDFCCLSSRPYNWEPPYPVSLCLPHWWLFFSLSPANWVDRIDMPIHRIKFLWVELLWRRAVGFAVHYTSKMGIGTGSDSIYFRLRGPYGFCCSYSTLLL